MRDDVAIRVENLGKSYRIYDRPQDRLKQLLWGRYLKLGYGREFWALRNLNLEVKRGETVGIVGRNGSGKSTFLQMLAAGLSPTTGTTMVHGRVAALLELGSGFNPEFSGRENVYLNAAVLGVPRELVSQRMDHILAFAEIGDFIDQPVRTYSSGMVVRLAFAVSIHIDADILIVDEALAVGDEAFCRKCFGKIRAFQESGGTILFVSHSAATVVELCQRAVLLDHGELLAVGVPKLIVGWYQKICNASNDRLPSLKEEMKSSVALGKNLIYDDQTTISIESPIFSKPRTGVNSAFFDAGLKSSSVVTYDDCGVEIVDPHICSVDGERVNNLVHGFVYIYTYQVCFGVSAMRVRFGMLFKTFSGYELTGAANVRFGQDNREFTAGSRVKVSFRWHCLLNPGLYFANAGVLAVENDTEKYLARVLDAIAFKVQPNANLTVTGQVGLVESSKVEII
jgi:lipopolysaccharide transport system ATP-binding protein